MKALPLILALSLAANVVYGALLLRRAASGPAPAPASAIASAAAGSEESKPAAGARSAVVPAPGTSGSAGEKTVAPAIPAPDDLHDLSAVKAKLTAEGYPAAVISSVLAVTTDEKYGIYEIDAALRKERTPELTQKRQEIFAKANAELRLYSDTAARLEEFRQRDYAARYGELPAEAIEAVRKIEREHNNETDRQFMASLRPLLTASQLEDYLRYNTVLARTVEVTLSPIDVDEAAYSALLAAAIAREGSSAPDKSARELAQNNLQPASAEVYRQVLGDEQFLKIAARFDATVASADGVYQLAGLSPARRADLFMETFKLKQTATRPENRETRVVTAQDAYEALIQKAGLTPEQIQYFDQGLGGELKRGNFGSMGFSSASHAW